MKVSFKGRKQSVTLDQSDFVAKGGEGDVYQKSGLVYKVCYPSKMIPEGKFKMLAALDNQHIVRPMDPFVTDTGREGYTMQFIPEAISLCQLVTVTYRNRNNVKSDTMLKLVRQMQDGFHFVHSKSCLLVDANELNFLVSKNLDFIHFIDVNSYETLGYPATAIMDTIRDRQITRGADGHLRWTKGSDWFSFAVISFQMFIGMHPFKGKHPNHPDPKTSMDQCMKHNLSVLNPTVKFPKPACLPFDVIPEVYRKWFEAVFENGQRVAPPKYLVATIVVTPVVPQVKQVVGSNTFIINEIANFNGRVVACFYSGGHQMVSTNEQTVYVDSRMVFTSPQPVKMGVTPQGKPLAAYLDGGQVHLYDLSGVATPISLMLPAETLMATGGRLYAKDRRAIYEITIFDEGTQVFASSKIAANVLENATQVFDGVVVQSLFDTQHVNVFPKSGECYSFMMRELDGYKVIEARYMKRVMMVMAVDTKTGQYDRFIFRFARDHSCYDMRIIRNVTNLGLNFTVLDNHRAVCITEEEKLEIFLSEKDHPAIKEIDDPAIEADMILAGKGNDALFSRGSKLYSITARTP